MFNDVGSNMRLITLVLVALLVLIQYPLWLGKKAGWLRVSDLETQVAASHKKTDELRARNAKLESEVRDLKEGTGAVEERARYELNMIKGNEIFVQVLDENGQPTVSKTALPPPPPEKKSAKPAH
ncbi:MAG: ftsB [Massilia sp.]|nr:ftsB [Massilia sp.]